MSGEAFTDAHERLVARAVEGGRALRQASTERLVAALAQAAARLADPTSGPGAALREWIPERAGLHPANVERTLQDALAVLAEPPLRAALRGFERAHHGRPTTPARLACFVLAGNVYTAALRPLAWALLCRVPVVLKPASADAGLTELFALALAEADPELAEAVGVVRFGRDEPVVLEGLASRADVVHAWGSDRTMVEVRAKLPASTAFVSHGHGLGLAYVPRAALSGLASAERVADALALDVALYDQRGCLSPHALLVEGGGEISPVDFAALLSERSLAALAREMPRGPMPLSVGAMQVQWRGIGAVRGELFEGDGWGVTFEGLHPIRLSPGYRNVAVHEISGPASLTMRCAPFGGHLKALGIAAPLEVRWSVASGLPASLCPRLCEVGHMQKPGLLSAGDGDAPWAGLVRVFDVD